MTAQLAFTQLQDAKDTLKIAKDAYKDAMESDSTLSDLAEAKKQAAADYKAERLQFDGKHAALVEKIADLSDEAKQAKLTFDETVEMAVRRGEQLSLFMPNGAAVSVRLTAKTSVEKAGKTTDDTSAAEA